MNCAQLKILRDETFKFRGELIDARAGLNCPGHALCDPLQVMIDEATALIGAINAVMEGMNCEEG